MLDKVNLLLTTIEVIKKVPLIQVDRVLVWELCIINICHYRCYFCRNSERVFTQLPLSVAAFWLPF